MRINYLELRNFANIFSAMHRKIIKIDLSKSKNRIVLLVGENGTGKTSILGELHPFAYPGNMDNRNDTSLIIEGHSGYKEIHFQEEDDIYIIKHHYLCKNDKYTVKSFISKNDTELNPNGNVSSFTQIIELEFALAQEYMKLIRLGSNVTTFIDLKAVDRKKFATKLLADLDNYATYYKKMVEDGRILKNVMKSVTDKIKRLNIVDRSAEENNLINLQNSLLNISETKNSIISELGSINGSIMTLVPQGYDTLISEIIDLEGHIDNDNRLLDKLKRELNEVGIITIGNINPDKSISQMELKISTVENEMKSNNNMIEFYLNHLNYLYSQKDEKENSLKYISSELDYSKINEYYLELNRKKNDGDKKYKGFNPSFGSKDVLSSITVMQEIDRVVSELYEFNNEALVKTINMFLNGKNIGAFIKKEVSIIDKTLSNLNMKLEAMSSERIPTDDKVYVLIKHDINVCNKCKYVQFYNDSKAEKNINTVDSIRASIVSLERLRDFYISFEYISKKIEYINYILNANKELLSKLNFKFMNIKHILSSVKNYIPFYEEADVTLLVSELEDYEEYRDLDKKIADVKKEIVFIEKNKTTVSTLQNDIMKLDNEISSINKKITDLEESNSDKLVSIEKYKKGLKSFIRYKEIQNSVETVSNSIQVNKALINEKIILKDKVRSFVSEKSILEQKLSDITKEINNINEKIEDIKYRIKEYDSLQKESEILSERFEENQIMRDSVSSTKGIPLLYIELFLKDSRIFANELLRTVYDDSLELCPFIINDKEFKIPYIKNGMKVEDVISCSQGERTFISLTISFALMKQAVKVYNIPLLDELDATLDQKKRTMFLALLEKQLDAIGAEQVFVISHNNMFDNYPVDVIMTSPVRIDNYKNTNVIFAA